MWVHPMPGAHAPAIDLCPFGTEKIYAPGIVFRAITPRSASAFGERVSVSCIFKVAIRCNATTFAATRLESIARGREPLD
jgi:hypothetical protein